ncbi:hypothetical protein SLEP1_g46296 [Rubroshorea leprosula]|uniref:Uncharacterized protein n=1 Tax=Rubroshorea leprosula TaxID=152421 RepID=A0AAV5LNQ5_9ROSI|nr:hypothetical protein SLEP1_g46296 [Rubroshorea leprosula]
MQDTNKVSSEPRGLFYLDAPSASFLLWKIMALHLLDKLANRWHCN